VRVDDDGDPRPFVSDLRESMRSRYGVVLESAADIDIPDDLDGLADATDEDSEDSDDETAAPATASDDDDVEISDDDEEPDEVLASAREALSPDLSDLEADGVVRASRTWAGDPGLLEDLGISAAELVQLTVDQSDDPAAVLAGIGEACGFDEQLDALR
jgi:hypothetical protein